MNIKYQITEKRYIVVETKNEKEKQAITLMNKLFYKERYEKRKYQKTTYSFEQMNESGFQIKDCALQNYIKQMFLKEILNKAIKSLPIKQQKIIIYLFYYEYPLYEIAKRLKTSIQNVNQIKLRALRNLRNILIKENNLVQ